MGVQVIPIPIDLVSSHSHCYVLFPFPRDFHSHWESHSHAHLYSAFLIMSLYMYKLCHSFIHNTQGDIYSAVIWQKESSASAHIFGKSRIALLPRNLHVHQNMLLKCKNRYSKRLYITHKWTFTNWCLIGCYFLLPDYFDDSVLWMSRLKEASANSYTSCCAFNSTRASGNV